MKVISGILLLALLPLAAVAATAGTDPVPVPLSAESQPEALLYEKRVLVVFADTERDPAFARQMALLARDPAALDLRDIVVLVDTDPATRSAWRQKLRPRGFSLVLVDKDGSVALRKPLPWDVREITHVIDRTPQGRQELLARPEAGG